MTGWLDAIRVESNIATYRHAVSTRFVQALFRTHKIPQQNTTKHESKSPHAYAFEFAIFLEPDQALGLRYEGGLDIVKTDRMGT
jgi:hypothetical protein